MVKHNRLLSSLLAAVLGFTYLILFWGSAVISYTVFLHFNSTNLTEATQNAMLDPTLDPTLEQALEQPLDPILDPTSEQLPEQTSEQLPEQTSEQLPEQTSEQLPEQTSEQLPEQTSEQISEDILEKEIDEEIVVEEAKISLPSREEILELYSEILAEKEIPKTPSSYVLDAVTTINELQEMYESTELTVEQNKEIVKVQLLDFDNSEKSLGGKTKHWQNDDNTVVDLSSLKKLLGTSSFSVFSESELESTSKQIKNFAKNLSKMLTKVDNYVEWYDLIEYLQKWKNDHHFTCTSQVSSLVLEKQQQQQQPSPEEMIEKWKKVATTSHFLTRGIEIEDALRERTEQYLSSSTIASPLTLHGTHEIHNYVENKAAETLEKFLFLETHWEMLKSNRMTKIQVLEQEASSKDDNSCVDDVEEIESALMEIIHEKRIEDVSHLTRVNENDVTTFDTETYINLWWIIQSPLFYKSFSLLDDLVDFISGYNEFLDQFIDFLMEMTSDDFSSFDNYNQISINNNPLLGQNLQRILQKKLYQTKLQVPKQVQEYLNKSGMLKNEVIKTIGKTVQMITENNGKKILDLGHEIKYWIEDLFENSF